MLRADSAKVAWQPEKKRWLVSIAIGEEVIKRPIPKQGQDAGEDVLRSLALATAKDEGYEVDPARVAVVR